MSKNRKTRRQKILSDLRHHVSLSPKIPLSSITDVENEPAQQSRFQYTFSSSVTEVAQARGVQTISLHQYTYLSKDLLKTAIVTGCIVALELVLAFGLKGL